MLAVAAPVAATALLMVMLSPSMSSALPMQTDDGTGTTTGETDAATTDGATTDDTTTDETGAETDTAGTEADNEKLSLGADVYTQICSACHQAGGAGLPGSYPPLINNPHVEDTEYVKGVIANGRKGEIVVDGETYNGVMPSFSTLAEDEVEAVVFYIQSGFQAPTIAAGQEAGGPVAGTELPALTNLTWQAGFLIAALVVLLIVGPRITSANSRLDTPWFDTFLKTATMVIAVTLAVAYIPNWVLQNSVVAGLPRLAQDLIGVSVWGLGLVLCLGAMWYAHRESRI